MGPGAFAPGRTFGRPVRIHDAAQLRGVGRQPPHGPIGQHAASRPARPNSCSSRW
jgi:hypothetical protein